MNLFSPVIYQKTPGQNVSILQKKKKKKKKKEKKTHREVALILFLCDVMISKE